MKIMNKIKNLFTEEIEEPKPIKKEVIQVEIAAPVHEEIKTEKKEPAPIFFDDKDFLDIEKSSKRFDSNLESYKYQKKKEDEQETKKFTPTPIISPVYGILNKNYLKEDIVNKADEKKEPIKNLNIDTIRKKAYGTLEDELENTLTSNKSFIFNESSSIDIFDEIDELNNDVEPNYSNYLDDTKENNLEQEIINYTDVELDSENDYDNLYNDKIEDDILNSDKIEDDILNSDKIEDDILNSDHNNNHNILKENDLLDLIDSMYDKEDE